jgi:hypothetical protein
MIMRRKGGMDTKLARAGNIVDFPFLATCARTILEESKA